MKNSELEKALKETWRNKDKFYRNNKNLSMIEIVKGVEKKYQTKGTAHNKQ